MKPKNIILGTFAAIVILVLIVLVLYTESQPPADVSVNTATSTVFQVPATWKTYAVAQAGITLEAPADFVPQPANNGYELLIPIQAPYVNTHLIHEAYIKIPAPAKACPTFDNALGSSTQVTINNVQFTRQESGDAGAGNVYQLIDYTATQNNKCYDIELYTHSTNGEGFYTDNQAQIEKVDAQQKQDITALFTLFDNIASAVSFSK